MTQACTSVVVAPIQLAAAVVVGAALSVPAAMIGHVWLAALIGLVMLATGLQVSVVRCAVGPQRMVAASGPWGRGRVIATSSIAEVSALDLTWPNVFGFGIPTARRTTRLTVRPGAALCLRLRSGEIVRVSVDDPATAQHVLDARSSGKETP